MIKIQMNFKIKKQWNQFKNRMKLKIMNLIMSHLVKQEMIWMMMKVWINNKSVKIMKKKVKQKFFSTLAHLTKKILLEIV